MSTGAEVVAHTLKKAGVDRVFGLPGGEVVDVIGACLQEGINFILTRHEAVASLTAGVLGQLTGKPGVCLSTLGLGPSICSSAWPMPTWNGLLYWLSASGAYTRGPSAYSSMR